MAEETVNVNPDGSTTFEGGEESTMPPVEDAGAEGGFEDMAAEAVKGTDPAIYLLLVVVLLGLLYFVYLRKSREDSEDEFFANLDGEKVCIQFLSPVQSVQWSNCFIDLFQFNLKLPAEVDEYYVIKEKCTAAGWEPGKVRRSQSTQSSWK